MGVQDERGKIADICSLHKCIHSMGFKRGGRLETG